MRYSVSVWTRCSRGAQHTPIWRRRAARLGTVFTHLRIGLNV